MKSVCSSWAPSYCGSCLLSPQHLAPSTGLCPTTLRKKTEDLDGKEVKVLLILNEAMHAKPLARCVVCNKHYYYYHRHYHRRRYVMLLGFFLIFIFIVFYCESNTSPEMYFLTNFQGTIYYCWLWV